MRKNQDSHSMCVFVIQKKKADHVGGGTEHIR